MVRFRSHRIAGTAGVNRIVLAVLKLLSLGAWPRGRSRSPQGQPASRRRVWRITDSRPEGGWVDADAPPTEAADDRSTLPMGSWTTSSMDLLDGVQVVELDDPAPGEAKPH